MPKTKAPDELKSRWSVSLTPKNVEAVATRFFNLLVGKRYTAVTTHEERGLVPVVRTGQRLQTAIGPVIVFSTDDEHPYIHIFDSYGLWQISATAVPYAYIEFTHDKVTIQHHAQSGAKICWVFAIEHQEE